MLCQQAAKRRRCALALGVAVVAPYLALNPNPQIERKGPVLCQAKAPRACALALDVAVGAFVAVAAPAAAGSGAGAAVAVGAPAAALAAARLRAADGLARHGAQLPQYKRELL